MNIAGAERCIFYVVVLGKFWKNDRGFLGRDEIMWINRWGVESRVQK